MIKYTHLWILKVLHYELKGVVTLTIPNPMILIHTLGLQEAKESSAIENIITTEDDLYQSHYNTQQFASIPAKEVHNYAQALYSGYKIVENDRLITNNTIKTIQRTLEENDAGFRTQAGTTLKNEQTGEIIYTPPQDANEIIRLMTDLEKFMSEKSHAAR